MKYEDKLRLAIEEVGSCLCVGLDPHLHMIPERLTNQISDKNERVVYFLEQIIKLTTPYCAAYKPNLAFYEALGEDGLQVFKKVLDAIPENKIIIADAKRGDIGSTAENYKKAFFDHWDVDAITLNPLMGFETLTHYYDYPSKALYVLALTSNPGASDFLEKPFSGFSSMAAFISNNLKLLQSECQAALGMVVGATKAKQLTPVLENYPTGPLLIPGIGKQGGNIEELVSLLAGYEGVPLVSSSRSILFAGGIRDNWEQAVEDKVKLYKKHLMPITKHYV